jgi:hypothetical protein
MKKYKKIEQWVNGDNVRDSMVFLATTKCPQVLEFLTHTHAHTKTCVQKKINSQYIQVSKIIIGHSSYVMKIDFLLFKSI